MIELTTYIQWLSNSVYSVYTDGLATWISDYSDQPYYERAYDRMAYDAAQSNYTNIDDWAAARIQAGDYYETQNIPPEYADAYYYAAERSRASGMIRKRMAFKRPPTQGLEGPGGPTKKQRAVRRVFKKAVDSFNNIGYSDRQSIYSDPILSGQWYYNYYIGATWTMIKKVQRGIAEIPTTTFVDAALGSAVNQEKCAVVIHGYIDQDVDDSHFVGEPYFLFLNNTTIRFYHRYDLHFIAVITYEVIEFY